MAITLNGTTGITTPGLITDDSTLTVDSANNRVGIGTNTPGAELEVASTSSLASRVRVRDSAGYGDLLIYNNEWSFQLNGSEKLRIENSGEVGIGTDNPGVILDVRETKTAGSTQIRLYNTDNSNTTTQTAEVNLSPDSRALAGAGIKAFKEKADFSTNTGRDVSLALNVVLNNAQSEAIRITSSGNVGIGTTNPSQKLDVNGVLKCGPGIAPFISAVFRDYNDGSAIYASVVQAGGGKFISGESYYFNSGHWRSDTTTSTAIGLDSGNIRFLTRSGLTANADFNGPIERLRITSSGNVGIGTDNPVGSLEVRDSKANLIVAKDGLTVKSNSDLHTTYDTLQIGAGGALLSYSIATVTADTQFVHNAYRSSGGTFKYRYADTSARIRMNSPGGEIIFDNAASGSADADITFSERLRITSSGNVGIGTDTVNFTQFGSNTAGVAIQDIGGTNTAIKLSDGNYHNYLVQAGNSNLYLSHYGSGGDIIFGTGSSGEERARLLYSGGLTFNGDTAAANALDDYEEGTFTPGFGVSTGTVSYSSQWGKYTKVGNVVYIWFRLVATNDANGALYYLTNLPFTIGGINGQYPGPCISNFYNLNIGSNGTLLGGYWRHGETRFRFHSNGNNTNQLTPTLTASSSFEIRGEGFYPVS